MPDETSAENECGSDHREDRRRCPCEAIAAPCQHQHHDHGGRHQQHAPEPVDLALAMEDRNLPHPRQQQRERQCAQRKIDPEDHRPVQMFGEQSAEHRSADSGRNPHGREIGLVLAAFARRHHVGNHDLHQRQDAAAADTLQRARENQRQDIRRNRAQHRADQEQRQRGYDHRAAAVDVAQRAVDRRDRGGGKKIRGDHPRQAGDVVELAADGRQRGGNDGLIERGQKHREHQAQQDGPHFAFRQRRRRHDRRRFGKIDDFGGDVRNIVRCIQRLRFVRRVTALSLCLCHESLGVPG